MDGEITNRPRSRARVKKKNREIRRQAIYHLLLGLQSNYFQGLPQTGAVVASSELAGFRRTVFDITVPVSVQTNKDMRAVTEVSDSISTLRLGFTGDLK